MADRMQQAITALWEHVDCFQPGYEQDLRTVLDELHRRGALLTQLRRALDDRTRCEQDAYEAEHQLLLPAGELAPARARR